MIGLPVLSGRPA